MHTRIYLDPLDTAGLARVYGAEEMQAEQQRSEMYADLVRRTAEALGMKMADGWHGLPERAASLRDALYAADRLMGHDDEQTDWRERWARLWG